LGMSGKQAANNLSEPELELGKDDLMTG
jgi:hypothetical protein